MFLIACQEDTVSLRYLIIVGGFSTLRSWRSMNNPTPFAFASYSQETTEVIRAAIRDSEATRYRIAKETGLEESALSRFMSGGRGLSMEALDTLAAYFNLQLVPCKPRSAGKVSQRIATKKAER